MNLTKIETGLASYLDTDDDLAALAEVREGVSDAEFPSAGTVVLAMADRAVNVVGPLYTGEIRVRVRTPKTKSGATAHRSAIDQVDLLFPHQGVSGYADAVAALTAAIETECDVECNGYRKTGWDDAEEDNAWIADLGITAGLKDTSGD